MKTFLAVIVIVIVMVVDGDGEAFLEHCQRVKEL